ncbi:MAG: hypothetical protein HOK16_09990, partial [Nitrospina sp.]|nr:hypothetical protein [Nitrospina sp.]
MDLRTHIMKMPQEKCQEVLAKFLEQYLDPELGPPPSKEADLLVIKALKDLAYNENEELFLQLDERAEESAFSNKTAKLSLAELEVMKEKAESANKEKSAFLANMSHEIRTPMNAIMGYSQILMREPNLDSEYKASIRNILSSGDHLLELINDVLDISKIEAGQMELHCADFDLTEFIQTVSGMFKKR